MCIRDSFVALDWGDPYGIFGKALQILKLESLGAADGEDLMILAQAPFLPDPPV